METVSFADLFSTLGPTGATIAALIYFISYLRKQTAEIMAEKAKSEEKFIDEIGKIQDKYLGEIREEKAYGRAQAQELFTITKELLETMSSHNLQLKALIDSKISLENTVKEGFIESKYLIKDLVEKKK